MTSDSQFATNQDRAGGSQRPVLVWLGGLDAAATTKARQVFADAPVIGASFVIVDVAGLDDHHELTGFSLLTELNRRLGENGGALSVRNPPPRLAGRLQAWGIRVHWDVAALPHAGLTVHIGAQPDGSEHGAPAHESAARPHVHDHDRQGPQ